MENGGPYVVNCQNIESKKHSFPLIEEECRCVCHANTLKKPYAHDTECCKEMNGYVEPTPPSDDWETSFVEAGADIEHDRWGRWQKYFFGKCLLKPQGEIGGNDDRYVYFALSKDLYERWLRQIDTPYSMLSESEKESDRKETRNYLPLVRTLRANLLEEILGCVPDERRVLSHITPVDFHHTAGFNQCRELMLNNIKKIR